MVLNSRITVCLLSIFWGALVSANPNTTLRSDLSFGREGVITLSLGGLSQRIRSIEIQPDGKILLVGGVHNGGAGLYSRDQVVVRLLPDGALDSSFGQGGQVRTRFGPGENIGYRSRLLPDGRIVVVGVAVSGGASRVAVSRYLPNGEPDAKFGENGVTFLPGEGEDQCIDMDLLQIGEEIRVVVLARLNFRQSSSVDGLFRLSSDGRLDTSFGPQGKLLLGPQARYARLMVDSAGRIVLGGEGKTRNAFYLERLLPDGSPDRSFAGSGRLQISFEGAVDANANEMIEAANGSLLLAGHVGFPYERGGPSTSRLGLALVSENGSLNPAFGHMGKVVTSISGFSVSPKGVLVVANGDIIVSAFARDYDPNRDAIPPDNPSRLLMTRFSPRGRLLETHAQSAGTPEMPHTVETVASALQSPEHLVAVGNAGSIISSTALSCARYLLSDKAN